MEEDLIAEVRGVPPLIFKPTLAFYGSNDIIKQLLYENGKLSISMYYLVVVFHNSIFFI